MQLQTDRFISSSTLALFITYLVSASSVEGNNGLCSIVRNGNDRKCCKGKDVSCFRYRPREYGDRYQKKCFCDEFCMRGNDCCGDYEFICEKKKQDCQVGAWGRWSDCSKKCGIGSTKRQRVVLVPQENGGRRCPPLVQRRVCLGPSCPVKKHVSRGRIAASRQYDVARILPGYADRQREEDTFSMKNDARKYLYRHYHSKSSSQQNLCARYVLMGVTRHCHYATGKNAWAARLKKGIQVCVTCHASVRDHYADKRCPGIGEYGKTSRWSAFNVPYCRGRWYVESKPLPCSCRQDNANTYSFV